MPLFTSSVVIEAPVARVFAFHEREDALVLLSPPFPPMRVVEKQGGIRPGGRVVLRIGYVVTWVALHTEYERNSLFVDEQVEGPFAAWTHRHEFAAEGGRTRLTDSVRYELPGGRLANVAAAPLTAIGLSRMFAYRHRVTKRLCEARG
jgi:ligand-binding SRPBCC domain-containing protein